MDTKTVIKKFLSINTFGDLLTKGDLKTLKGIISACVKRAYRDFQRLMWNADSYRKAIGEAEKYLCEKLQVFFSGKLMSQARFDEMHKEICDKLIEKFVEADRGEMGKGITYGIAQKWLNMSFKYLFVFTDKDYLDKSYAGITLKESYFTHCHTALDSVVLKWCCVYLDYSFRPVIKQITPWSKLNNYDDYMILQKEFRHKYYEPYAEKTPFLAEFTIWNVMR